MLRSAIRAVLIGQVLAAGCRSGLNYPNPLGPRYAGAVSPVPAAPPHPDPAVIRVVTFNIAYGRHIERAIELLQAPLPQPLRSADIISLQEMDAASTARIAGVLGMSYVYYPAIVHPKTGRDFGNAILSRWPIVADAKIVLPHLARFRHTERIATAATILIGDVAVRVYSVHLGTIMDIGPGARRDQARAVLADAATFPRVVVAGDMNSHAIGKEFSAAGFLWPTEHNPSTDRLFKWDHIFLKGFAVADSAAAGVVRDNHGASDHRPVWAVAELRATTPS